MEFKVGDIVRIPSGGCLKKAVVKDVDGEVVKCYLCKRGKNKYFPVSLLEEGAALWAAQVEAQEMARQERLEYAKNRKRINSIMRRFSDSFFVPDITDELISNIVSKISKRTDVNNALSCIPDFLVGCNNHDAAKAGTEEHNALVEVVQDKLYETGSSANEFEYQVRERVWSSIFRLNEERKESDRCEMIEKLVEILKNRGATVAAMENMIERDSDGWLDVDDFVRKFDASSAVDEYLFNFAGIDSLERFCWELRYDEAKEVLSSISVEEVLERFKVA